MKKILTTLMVAGTLTLGACATIEPVPQGMIDAENACFAEVAKAKVEQYKASSKIQIVEFEDERNYVMALAIEKLGEVAKPVQVSEFVPCTLTVQAYLREHGKTTRSQNQIWGKAVDAVKVVGGVYVGGMALESILGAAGSTYIGSRHDSAGDNIGDLQTQSGDGTQNLNRNPAPVAEEEGEEPEDPELPEEPLEPETPEVPETPEAPEAPEVTE